MAATVTSTYNIITQTNAPETAGKVIGANKAIAASLQSLQLQADFTAISMNMVKTSAMVMGGAILATAGATALAILATKDFDASMKRIAALGGAEFQGRLQELQDEMFRLSKTWGIAVDDIAKGAIELVKTGFGFEEVKVMIEGVAKAAIANEVSFEQVAGTAASAFLLFRDSGYSVSEMLEILHTSAAEARLDFEDWDDILGFVGSSAVIFGLTIEEVAATMAALSQAAFTSRQSVRTMMLKLATEAEDVEKIIRRAGVEIDILTEEGKLNLTAIIGAMKEANITTDDWILIMKELSIRSGAAFTTIIAMSEEYERILGVLGPETENLGIASEVMATSLNSLLTQIMSILQEAIFSQDFIELLSDVLKEIKVTMVAMAPQIRVFLELLIRKFVEMLPDLLVLFEKLIELFVKLIPMMIRIADVGMFFLNIISAIPTPVLQMILVFGIFYKMLGPITTALAAMRMQMQAAAIVGDTHLIPSLMRQTVLLSGMMGVLGSLMFGYQAVSAASMEEKAIFSALTGVTWALVAAQIALAIAKTGATLGPGAIFAIPILAGVIGAGLTMAIASVAAAKETPLHTGADFVPMTGPYMLERGERVISSYDVTNQYGMTAGTVNINIFDASKDDIDYTLQKYGR